MLPVNEGKICYLAKAAFFYRSKMKIADTEGGREKVSGRKR